MRIPGTFFSVSQKSRTELFYSQAHFGENKCERRHRNPIRQLQWRTEGRAAYGRMEMSHQ